MSRYVPVEGIVTDIEPVHTGDGRNEDCCTLIFTVRTENRNVVNFIIDNNTYFIDHVSIKLGDSIVAFYDSTLFTILVYPQQYKAIVVMRLTRNCSVKVIDIGPGLVSTDGSVRLDISEKTKIITRNSQIFPCDIENHTAAIVYTKSTRSYPAIIMPNEIIILCN
ncbi:MAG: hypothetical protein PHD46_07545 [Eubacteriales bacterium]|nr:hypothetical protein [Eubacteriales bacterium]